MNHFSIRGGILQAVNGARMPPWVLALVVITGALAVFLPVGWDDR